jgi:hypothetical protein
VRGRRRRERRRGRWRPGTLRLRSGQVWQGTGNKGGREQEAGAEAYNKHKTFVLVCQGCVLAAAGCGGKQTSEVFPYGDKMETSEVSRGGVWLALHEPKVCDTRAVLVVQLGVAFLGPRLAIGFIRAAS